VGRVPPTQLALAGLFAIVAFATIGQFAHNGGVDLGDYAALVLPFGLCWLAVCRLTKRFLPTWLVGVSAGVAIRMVVLGHERWSELAFAVVSLVVVGALSFVLLWLMVPRAALPQS